MLQCRLYKSKKLHDPSAISADDRNRSFTRSVESISDHCQKTMSRPDCDTLEYFRYIKELGVGYPRNILNLVVSPSYVPLINIVHNESITLIDFIVYVLGTLSFWLCLSPFNNLNTIYEHSINYRNRNQSSTQAINCNGCSRINVRLNTIQRQLQLRIDCLRHSFFSNPCWQK